MSASVLGSHDRVFCLGRRFGFEIDIADTADPSASPDFLLI